MSRPDPDLIAVRDLPPGVPEPSDEAMARVWHRITARPEPVAGRRLRPRIWIPVVAAVAVVLVVGAGIAAFRPHTQTLPAGPEFSSDPAYVAEVFAGLIAAAERAEPVKLRAGQLIYRQDDRIRATAEAPQPVRMQLESWIDPDLMEIYWNAGPGTLSPEFLARARAEESAQHPRPAGRDTRPWAPVKLDGPSDPVTALRAVLERSRFDEHLSQERRIWNELLAAASLDPFLPTAWRGTLYRLLAGLPVSVAETTIGERRLTIVRMLDGVLARDLIVDPSTGQFAGAQLAHFGSAIPPVPSGETLSGWPYMPFTLAGSLPLPSSPVDPSEIHPGVEARSLWRWAVVEEVGERP
jgi:hypothetical protein